MEDYTILFDHLAEVTAQEHAPAGIEATSVELDEIAELHRAVLEITDPTPTSYTMT
ncbi:MAG: hypothetical protein ABSC05_14340 [Candidatus Solibacter sp.]|jgi:hypothetical protein